ncbi:MAG: hypothetical protein J6Q85_05700 [Clostridia bacterium]|nr:hypothetical protein [Clostridia bacterium]
MSILSWFVKPKREMAKKDTKHVKIGKYTITSHAQNRTVDPARKLTKKDMVVNLFGRESKNSKTYIHKDGTMQYDRVNDKNRTVTYITQNSKKVKTIRKYHNNAKGKKDAYRNF